jgi:hypothetical protein
MARLSVFIANINEARRSTLAFTCGLHGRLRGQGPGGLDHVINFTYGAPPSQDWTKSAFYFLMIPH